MRPRDDSSRPTISKRKPAPKTAGSWWIAAQRDEAGFAAVAAPHQQRMFGDPLARKVSGADRKAVDEIR